MNAVRDFLRKYDGRPVIGERRGEDGKLHPVLGEPLFLPEPPRPEPFSAMVGSEVEIPTDCGISNLGRFLAGIGHPLGGDDLKAFRHAAILTRMAIHFNGLTDRHTVGLVARECISKGKR